jgi:hypothetical protein
VFCRNAEDESNVGFNAFSKPDGSMKTSEDPPSEPALWNGLGVRLSQHGNFSRAAEYFRRAIALLPSYGEPYRRLVSIGQASSKEGIESQLEELLESSGLLAVDRIDMEFALGKLAHDQGNFRRALYHYKSGNDLQLEEIGAGTHQFNEALYREYIDRTASIFSAEYLHSRNSWGIRTDRPIFIVGMPRSGSTLVEQILATDEKTVASGELQIIAKAVRHLSRRATIPSGLEADRWIRSEVEEAARQTLSELMSSNRAALRIVDKQLDNVLLLGVVRLLFPLAKIIICRRDVADACLSCYFQKFEHGNEFSYSLAQCFQRHRQVNRIIDYWMHTIPDSILVVHYEDVVTNLYREGPRIFEFAGLNWTDRNLLFHLNAGRISTLSYWQVRQPIYATSIGLWHRYAPYLAEVGLETANVT